MAVPPQRPDKRSDSFSLALKKEESSFNCMLVSQFVLSGILRWQQRASLSPWCDSLSVIELLVFRSSLSIEINILNIALAFQVTSDNSKSGYEEASLENNLL